MSKEEIGPAEITEWLDNQSSFSLELKVCSHASTSGFEVEHGGTYSDPVTDKPRQFDIRCIMRKEHRAIKFAVECKALSREFPLVIQRVPRTQDESFHDVLIANEPECGSIGLAYRGDNTKIVRTEYTSDLYPSHNFVGKACNQIGKKNDRLIANDKEVYDKWSQAISSAHDLIDVSVYEREKLGHIQSLTAVFPVLVVSDACLWCVNYDREGNRSTEPMTADAVEFYISKEYWRQGQMHPAYTVSHLHIMTLSGYEQFLRRVATSSNYWSNVFPTKNLKEVT